MDGKTIAKVEDEMKRLGDAIIALKQDTKNSGRTMDELWWGTRYTGAVRRASMDLTRALADLRR